MKIIVDSAKCSNALDCLICLDQCPCQIFIARPTEPRQPGKLTEKKTIQPVFLSRCNGCEVCVKLCPKGAVQLST
ncbi:MAG: 4Fe-4S binding protein [Planctomycetota bacterium]|jgi:NAD-dependent dihydropyrimidine dehydrogenase PreA subunit